MNIFEELVGLLKARKLKITFAESCTGGLLAAETVAVADASSVFDGSFVTYSNEIKCKYVGVCSETIEKFGVVSENVALEMAKGALANTSADVAVGVTGYAGPATDENDTTAGTVCFGFIVNGKTMSSTKHFGDVGRNVVRELSAVYAANTIIRLIKAFGDTNEKA